MNAALQAEWGHIRNTARFSQDHQCREPMKCTTEVIVDERSEFALISVTGPIDRSRTPYLVSLRQKRSRNPQVSPSETPPGCKSLYPQRSVVRTHKIILMFVPQAMGLRPLASVALKGRSVWCKNTKRDSEFTNCMYSVHCAQIRITLQLLCKEV
jgi:hypothetical protein